MLQTSKAREDHSTTGALESLEERVQRLEKAVAALQAPTPVEDCASDRPARSTGLLEAGRRLLPAALDTFRPPAALPAGESTMVESPRPGWWLFELGGELRAMVRMCFDPRYRVSWTCRLLPPLFLAIMFLSWWCFGSSWLLLGFIPLLGVLLDKLVDIALVLVAYKVLSREVRRYRQALAGFAARTPPVARPATR